MTHTQGKIISQPTSNTVIRDLQNTRVWKEKDKLLYATILPYKYQKPTLIQMALAKSFVGSHRTHGPCTIQGRAG